MDGVPRPVQVVFQGGGAKLCALIAAAEAVQSCQSQGAINVTRAAGTSAGAIAACMLATGLPMAHFRERLSNIGATYLPKILSTFPEIGADLDRDDESGWFSVILKALINKKSLPRLIIRGEPLLNERALREFIYQLFKTAGRQRIDLLDDLPLPVLITAVDIRNGDKIVYRGDGQGGGQAREKGKGPHLVDAIVDSCALPFLLRTHASGGTIVDGGICENLPADELVEASSQFGEVIGFSYARNETPQAPTNVLAYGKALLDSAINNSVDRAITRIGEARVFRLPTSIQTYEFKRGLEEGLNGHHYEHQRLDAERWIMRIAGQWVRPLSEHGVVSSIIEPLTMPEMMNRVMRVHDAQSGAASYNHVGALLVTAFSLLPSSDPRAGLDDEICQLATIEPLTAVRAFSMALIYSTESPVVGTTGWRVLDATNRFVETDVIPVVCENETDVGPRKLYRALYFFKEPLEPGERSPYTITQISTQHHALYDFRTKGRTHVFHFARTAAVAKSEIVICLPTIIGPVILEDIELEKRPKEVNGEPVEWVQGSPLPGAALAKYPLPPDGFIAYGWQADSGLRQGQATGVVVLPKDNVPGR